MQANISHLKELDEIGLALRSARIEQMPGTADAERLDHRMAELSADLDADVVSHLERLHQRYGQRGLVATDGTACPECYVNLPTKDYGRLVAGEPIICSNCARILYASESVSAA